MTEYDNTNRGSIWKNDKKNPESDDYRDTLPDFTGDGSAAQRQRTRRPNPIRAGVSMSNQLVSDDAVEKALDWLRDNAEEMGNAKRESVKADHMIKHTRALAMKQHGGLPVSAQEREAFASQEYLDAIEKAAEAAGEFERMKAMREAAALKIEVWRSMGANYRAMKI